MRRILLVLTVGLMMAAMMLVMAVPAFARESVGGNHTHIITQGPNAGQPVGGFGTGGFPGGCGGGFGPNGAGGGGGGGPGGDPCVV